MANNRMTKIADSLLNILIALTFSVLIVACVLQVFTRFVLNTSLSWTEELARYAFIWSNMLGAAFCTKRASHASVTVIVDTVPKSVQKILKVVAYVLVVVISVVLLFYGTKVAYGVRKQLSPALRISMSAVYSSLPVSALFITYYAAEHLCIEFRKLVKDGGEA